MGELSQVCAASTESARVSATMRTIEGLFDRYAERHGQGLQPVPVVVPDSMKPRPKPKRREPMELKALFVPLRPGDGFVLHARPSETERLLDRLRTGVQYYQRRNRKARYRVMRIAEGVRCVRLADRANKI